MQVFNPNPGIPPRVLATDLDGTLIPLPGNDDNLTALEILRQAFQAERLRLVFATGRHLESVLDAMRQHALPTPDWIVCDVGTSIYRRKQDVFVRFVLYEEMLAGQTHGADRVDIERLLIGINGLTLQPSDRQQRFKISYVSSAAGAEQLADLVNRRLAGSHLPFACLTSIDPFHNVGLLDILPVGASKAAALLWLATQAAFSPDEIIFAGDSGNDFAALACGFRAIVVANAPAGLADRVERELNRRHLAHRLFRAAQPATSGVLEGCRHFGLVLN